MRNWEPERDQSCSEREIVGLLLHFGFELYYSGPPRLGIANTIIKRMYDVLNIFFIETCERYSSILEHVNMPFTGHSFDLNWGKSCVREHAYLRLNMVPVSIVFCSLETFRELNSDLVDSSRHFP